MTMKPNTELNTMMFFDDALESERTYLLTELADAVSETRTAADQAAELNEDGEAGLLRLTEIWCAMNGVPAIVIFEGSQSELLANVVAQIYAHLLQHPFHDPVGPVSYTHLYSGREAARDCISCLRAANAAEVARSWKMACSTKSFAVSVFGITPKCPQAEA